MRILFLFTLIVFLVVGCRNSAETHDHDMAAMETDMEISQSDDLDTSTSKMSDAGAFHVTVVAEIDPVPINELHTWTLTIMDAEMQPVNDATITFGGGMPEHNHGFPTEPQVRAGDGDGEYQIEGVKMQMAGWWEMILEIESAETTDTITFNIVLP